MSAILARGRALYDAPATDDDMAALEALLSDDLVGELTAGLPNGFGGWHEGRDAVLSQAWGPVVEAYGIVPEAEAPFAGDGVLVGRGHYVGTARAPGPTMHPAFAHFWPFDGERFTGVVRQPTAGPGETRSPDTRHA